MLLSRRESGVPGKGFCVRGGPMSGRRDTVAPPATLCDWIAMPDEPPYCEKCRAPWVWGNDFCVQCGFVLVTP